MAVTTSELESVLDVDALLAPVSEQPPCGPDLQYDQDYLDCEGLAKGKPEQQFGAKVIAAVPPRWEQVLPRAVGLLHRSKDLRIACLLVRALVGTRGFTGLLPGLRLVDGLLRTYWDCVHPMLDDAADNDATARMNALVPLADAQSLLRELRDAVLVRSGIHGQVLVRDVEQALGRLPARTGTKPPTQAQLQVVLAGIAAEQPQVLPAATETLETARRLVSLLEERVGTVRMPDFKPLLGTLQAVAQLVPQPVTQPLAAADPGGAEGAVDMPPSSLPASAPPGELRTRQEAVATIDRLVEYIERTEPTNPASLLLRRARRFMSMNFVDILKEISPESMAKIDAISGPRDAT